MKSVPFVLLFLIICSGPIFAQNKAGIMVSNVKSQPVPTLFFNHDTTAIFSNKNLLIDVGYGYEKGKNILTPVNSIDVKELSNDAYSTYSMQDYLRTHFPLYSGKELIVIDGVPGGALTDVSPANIKSIQLLTGASAAMYGVRGFYGVLVIDTK